MMLRAGNPQKRGTKAVAGVLAVMMTAGASAALAETPDGAAPAKTPPVSFDAVLTVDGLSNLEGGVRTGTWSMQNLDLTATWQGDHGWSGFGYILVDRHGGFSDRYSGDAQVVSNIDATPGTRLFEAWVRKTSDDQASTTTFGLINLNGIFDTQPVGAVFLNASSGIGPDYSQSGPSIFPVSGLGLVEEWHVTDALRLRGGVFDGVPGDPDHGSIFTSLHMSADEGLHYVVEAEDNFKGGFIKVGHWAYSVRDDRLDGTGSGIKQGTYGQLGLTLTREKGSDDQGLSGWLRAGVANDVVLDLDSYAGGGLVYTGLLSGRDNDQAGLAISRAHFGRPYRWLAGVPVQAETTYELTYQAQIKPGLVVQPDMQYIRHPGGSGLKDALVVGVRVRLGLSALGGQ